MIDREEVLTHYMIAALWSSTDENGEPLDADHELSDISAETQDAMRADIATFLDQTLQAGVTEETLRQHMSEQQLGHDLWLTRNRHGAGFWDRGYPKPLSTKLTELARLLGESELYVGDDGKVYA